MTKNIETLTEDIYSLFTSGDNVTLKQEDIDKLGKDLATVIASVLSEKRSEDNKLRLSQIGKPNRRIWYDLNTKSDKKEQIDGATYIKFLYGHILEELLVFLCRAAGHEVTEQQKEVTVGGVLGHKDGRVDGTLVDFKSASSYSFKKFVSGEFTEKDPFGYIPQLSAYATDGDDKGGAFVVIDKTTGEIAVCPLHQMDMIDAEARVKEIKSTLTLEQPPEKCFDDRPEGQGGNRALDFGCVYCPHKFDCWADCNNGAGLRIFKYSNGIKYLTAVPKLPKVEEITQAVTS
jgi:hypothetical protein|tara:strand:+ start:4005 stop:4871 length:867 start_codon:yes stop_codon:yes gene_type:complete